MKHDFRWINKNGEQVLQFRSGNPHLFKPKTVVWSNWKDVPKKSKKVYSTASLAYKKQIVLEKDGIPCMAGFGSNCVPVLRMNYNFKKNDRKIAKISVGNNIIKIINPGHYFVSVLADIVDTHYRSKLEVSRTNPINQKYKIRTKLESDQELPTYWKIDFEKSQ